VNGFALLRPVLGMLSPEVKGLIVAVVAMAKGAGGFGPPSPPPHVEQWCRNTTRPGVPWQLLAAALSISPERGAEVATLAPAVLELGLVPGIARWTDSESLTNGTLLAFLAFTARDLDPEGLDALSSAFSP